MFIHMYNYFISYKGYIPISMLLNLQYYVTIVIGKNYVGIMYVQHKIYNIFIDRCCLTKYKLYYIPSITNVCIMTLVKGACERHTHDSHYLLCAIMDYLHKIMYYFRQTHESVTCDYQVTFKLYCSYLQTAHTQYDQQYISVPANFAIK